MNHMWWRHDKETFSALLAFQGIPTNADAIPFQGIEESRYDIFFVTGVKILTKNSTCLWCWDTGLTSL